MSHSIKKYALFQTLPFLSESMVYGVLEGIVISTSADGALLWSPKLGCAILSSATTVEMPDLGDVCYNLVTYGPFISYQIHFYLPAEVSSTKRSKSHATMNYSRKC